MNRSFLIHCIIGLVMCLLSCQTSPKEDSQSANAQSSPVEWITKSYSVKKESGMTVKDTVNQVISVVKEGDKELMTIYYNLLGEVDYKDVYKYDAQGKKIGSEFYEGGKQTMYYDYSYDEKDQMILSEAYRIETDSFVYNTAWRYNQDTTRSGYINDEGKFVAQYIYIKNESDDDLQAIYIRRDGSLNKTEYSYTEHDTDGEWLERTASRDGEIYAIETRERRDYE